MSAVNAIPSGQPDQHASLREVSDEQLQEILEQHRRWVESRGIKGAQADLNGTNLRGRSLQGALLLRAVLAGADLAGADLSDAELAGANLQGANLQDAVLWDAGLQGADLRGAIGLVATQMGAADLAHAQLPEELLPLEEHTNVQVATQNADKLLVTMLLGCVFAVLTIAATTDAGLLGNDTSTALPIIGTEIRIVGFYVVAPLILLGFYLYFHLYLQFVWDALANLPAVFPDGVPVHRKAYPWLLSGLPRTYWRRLRPERTLLTGWMLILSLGTAWGTVPVTLGLFWWKFLSRLEWLHSPSDRWLIGLHLSLLVVAVWVGHNSFCLGRALLCRNSAEIDRWKRVVWDRHTGHRLATALLIGFLLAALTPRLMRAREADLGGGSLDGVEIAGAYLPNADLEGARLRGAHLERVQLQNSHLEGAQLQGAHLAQIHLEEAHLEQADLGDADLKGAHLDRAFLRNAVLQGALLWKADLEEADLREVDLQKGAVLQSARLRAAQLQGAHLARANLRAADLEGADLDGADLERANLRDAQLQQVAVVQPGSSKPILLGASLEDADLLGADLRGANLRGARYNAATRWPAGFDPQRHGAIKVP